MSIRIDGTNTTANPGTTGADADTGLVYGSNEVKIVTGGTDRVKVDSSGRLGVATSSPSHKLDVRENNSAAARIGGSTFAMEIGQLGSSSSPGFNALGGGAAMLFRLNGTEAMRLDTSLNLLIGGTTASSADIALNANGSITAAAGNVNINKVTNGANLNVRNDASSATEAIEVYKGGFTVNDRTASIKNDGSAEFANSITAGSGSFQSSATSSWFNTGTSLYSNDYVWAVKNSSTNTWHSGLKTNGDLCLGNVVNNPNIELKGSDGSITAASGNTQILSNGVVQIKRDGGSLALGVFPGNNFTDSTSISLKTDGSATFAGRVNAGTNTSTNHSVVIKNSDSTSILVGIKYGGNGNIFEGRNADVNANVATSTISATGNATFAGGGSFGGEVTINGTAATTQRYFNLKDAGSSTYRAALRRDAWYLGTGVSNIGDVTPGNANIVLKMNGDAIFSGSVTASNVSDIRFKENITDANSQLADAVALGSQLKNFDWNDDAPLNEELRAKRFLGLVAQEAEKVCPGLTYTVPRTKQGKELTPAVLDEEGNETKAATYEELDDSYKAINHDILVMKLLGAVAELSAKVAALEAG